VHLSNGRILVTAGPRIVEIAGPERVRQLLAAPNVYLYYGDSFSVSPTAPKPAPQRGSR
jgi:hypothetical protein